MGKRTYRAVHAAVVALTVSVALVPFAPALADLEERLSTDLPPIPVRPEPKPRVQTLPQAVSLAYEYNPTLLSDRSLVRAADQRLVQARSAYGPTLDASASYGYTYNRFENILGGKSTQKGWSGTAALIFNQPLFTSGRIKSAVQSAEADIEFTRQNGRFSENQTLLDVYSNYVDVVRNLALVDNARQNLALLDQQFGDSQRRFDVREITRTDLDQVTTRREFGRANLDDALGQLSVARGQFLRVIGALPGELAPPSPLPVPATLEEAQAIAERNSPLLLAAHARERASRAQIRRSEAEYGPTISLNGQAQYGGVTPYSNDLDQTVLQGRVLVELPIYNSGAREARVSEARERNNSDWRLIDQALRDVHSEVERNWDNMISAQNSLSNLERAVIAAESAYDGAVSQERAGLRTTLDVLDLLRDLLSVRSELANSRADAAVARAGLLAAMGQLEPGIMNSQVTPYDPAPYLNREKDDGDSLFIAPTVDVLDSFLVEDTVDGRPYRDPAAGVTPTGLPAGNP